MCDGASVPRVVVLAHQICATEHERPRGRGFWPTKYVRRSVNGPGSRVWPTKYVRRSVNAHLRQPKFVRRALHIPLWSGPACAFVSPPVRGGARRGVARAGSMRGVTRATFARAASVEPSCARRGRRPGVRIVFCMLARAAGS
eukprot:gene17000-biopygen2290